MTDTEPNPIEKLRGDVRKSLEMEKSYERAAHLLVPHAFFPFLAAFFVILCGIMAVMLFGVGKIFGGALFSCVVLVGLYVLWNNIQAWRSRD